jgi:hypothetical protein
MKQFLGLLALCVFAPLIRADFVSTYDDATVVTGPDGNPAWQLTSDSTNPDGGVYVTITGTLTPATLTQLSADYVMETGTFGGGAPRFSIIDTTNNTYNEAYVYFGTPEGGGAFTDPNNGNTNYANTGNYADLSSPDVRVYSNGFGGFGNGNTGQTWAQFVASVGTVDIGYISLDLDGGFTGDQVMDTTNFDVNGTVYAPPAAVPEPGSFGLMLCLFAVLGIMGPFSRRRRLPKV